MSMIPLDQIERIDALPLSIFLKEFETIFVQWIVQWMKAFNTTSLLFKLYEQRTIFFSFKTVSMLKWHFITHICLKNKMPSSTNKLVDTNLCVQLSNITFENLMWLKSHFEFIFVLLHYIGNFAGISRAAMWVCVCVFIVYYSVYIAIMYGVYYWNYRQSRGLWFRAMIAMITTFTHKHTQVKNERT